MFQPKTEMEFIILCVATISDFANEDVEIVQSIANLEFTKAAILGNHDAWKTQHFSTKKKDRVQLRLEWFGVQDMEQSARRIYNVGLGAPEDHLVIILGHNGPTVLGSNLNDICGKDWVFGGGGDHGDPDLAEATSRLKDSAKVDMSLVVFGHMHKELAHRAGVRKLLVVGTDDIMYLNGAIVPRVKGMNGARTSNHRKKPRSRCDLAIFTRTQRLDEPLHWSRSWTGESIKLQRHGFQFLEK